LNLHSIEIEKTALYYFLSLAIMADCSIKFAHLQQKNSSNKRKSVGSSRNTSMVPFGASTSQYRWGALSTINFKYLIKFIPVGARKTIFNYERLDVLLFRWCIQLRLYYDYTTIYI